MSYIVSYSRPKEVDVPPWSGSDSHQSSHVLTERCMMELRPLVMCFALCVVYATSKPMEKKDRVHHDDPLSVKEHDDAESFDYDHDAFLGEEEAKTFDQLTPEESKERLGYGTFER